MHSEISPMERNVCVAWWTIFVTQMMKWEAKLDRFDLPDWHTAIGELTALIEERVDTEGFWEYDA